MKKQKDKGDKDMKFKTDFLAEDYSGLCWFQAKTASRILAAGLSLALGLTLGSAVSGLLGILIGIVIAGAVYPLLELWQKKSVKKRADKRFAAFSTSSELYLTINDDEILQNSNSGETRLPWADVYAVRESEESYYVFLTKRKAFYFPKRSFESDDAKTEFLGYITKHVPSNKIKLKK